MPERTTRITGKAVLPCCQSAGHRARRVRCPPRTWRWEPETAVLVAAGEAQSRPLRAAELRDGKGIAIERSEPCRQFRPQPIRIDARVAVSESVPHPDDAREVVGEFRVDHGMLRQELEAL